MAEGPCCGGSSAAKPCSDGDLYTEIVKNARPHAEKAAGTTYDLWQPLEYTTQCVFRPSSHSCRLRLCLDPADRGRDERIATSQRQGCRRDERQGEGAGGALRGALPRAHLRPAAPHAEGA